MSTTHREYTPGEEIANSVIHGIGAGLAIAALSVLVTLAAGRGDAWHVVSFSIYGATLVLLYSSSTVYHALRAPRAKRAMRMMDHMAIFLLIAGSYTPFTLVTLRGPWGWTLFGLIWGIAVAGIVFKVFFTGRLERASVALYILMSWLALIAIKPLASALPVGGLVWLALGGVFYMGGVAFYRWHRLRFHHAVWHVCVLGGSLCHFLCMLWYVLPPAGATHA